MLKPLGNRVLIRPLTEDDKTAGGIVLPDSAKKKPLEGEILAVGDGERLDSGEVAPIPLNVGDVVVYPEFGGTEVRVNEEDLLIVDADSILAVKTSAKKPAKKRAKK
ncbi:MAG: co-chaperone GroES [Armatimonadota bacterium]